MTAHATIEERQRCLAAGMNDHISKPIDPAVLFETVGALLQAWPERDQRAGAPRTPSRRAAHGAPPASGDDARPPTAALPSVDGLDTADGLLRVGGQPEALPEAAAPVRRAAGSGAGAHRRGLERGGPRGGRAPGPHGQGRGGQPRGRPRPGRRGGPRAGDRQPRRRRRTSRPCGKNSPSELGTLIGRLRPALAKTRRPRAPPPAPPADPEVVKTLVARCACSSPSSIPPRPTSSRATASCSVPSCAATTSRQFERHIQGYAFGEAQALLERAATAHGRRREDR